MKRRYRKKGGCCIHYNNVQEMIMDDPVPYFGGDEWCALGRFHFSSDISREEIADECANRFGGCHPCDKCTHFKLNRQEIRRWRDIKNQNKAADRHAIKHPEQFESPEAYHRFACSFYGLPVPKDDEIKIDI